MRLAFKTRADNIDYAVLSSRVIGSIRNSSGWPWGGDVGESEIYGGNWSCYKLTDKVIASAEEKRAWIGCYNWVSIGVSMEREELGNMASVA